MAKEGSEKKVKKEKKEKRSETNGVKKEKKEKKEKKSKSKALTDALLNELEMQKHGPVAGDKNGDVVTADVGEFKNEDDLKKMKLAKMEALVPFANPLADEKQTKKLLKAVKKGAKNKTLKRGVKEVCKAVRKSPSADAKSSDTSNAPGIVIIAADISPMDVISHLPVLCEDHNIPYIYVTSRAELGAAGSTKRPTSVVMLVKERSYKAGQKPEKKSEEEEEFEETYADILKLVQKAGRSVRI